MKIIKIILTILIVLLSITAGLAKVMQLPEEMIFLTELGLNSTMILVFGVIQIISGFLLATPKSKLFGLVLTAIAFLTSAILVFISGDILFTIVSMLPVAITLFLIYQTHENNTSITTGELNN